MRICHGSEPSFRSDLIGVHLAATFIIQMRIKFGLMVIDN